MIYGNPDNWKPRKDNLTAMKDAIEKDIITAQAKLKDVLFELECIDKLLELKNKDV